MSFFYTFVSTKRMERMFNYKFKNIFVMDKLIKVIEKIVEENFLTGDISSLTGFEQGFKIGKSLVAHDLHFSLLDYKERHSQESIAFGRIVDCDQWRQINELVDDASLRWQLLPDNALNLKDLSVSDAYNLGYVASVLQMMRIFGIDEKIVKK